MMMTSSLIWTLAHMLDYDSKIEIELERVGEVGAAMIHFNLDPGY